MWKFLTVEIYKSGNICFSYDLRQNSKAATHWQEEQYFKNNRAYFQTTTEPAVLNIYVIREQDEGEYRCRVDFTTSPTRNTRIHLTVIGLYIFNSK